MLTFYVILVCFSILLDPVVVSRSLLNVFKRQNIKFQFYGCDSEPTLPTCPCHPWPLCPLPTLAAWPPPSSAGPQAPGTPPAPAVTPQPRRVLPPPHSPRSREPVVVAWALEYLFSFFSFYVKERERCDYPLVYEHNPDKRNPPDSDPHQQIHRGLSEHCGRLRSRELQRSEPRWGVRPRASPGLGRHCRCLCP